jgi:hypothetical protein
MGTSVISAAMSKAPDRQIIKRLDLTSWGTQSS